jgi:hypothetical protein
LRAGTREVAISFCATAQYSFTPGSVIGVPTTSGRGSLAQPDSRATAVTLEARQAILRAVSSPNPRMMCFMVATLPEEKSQCGREDSGFMSWLDSVAQFS